MKKNILIVLFLFSFVTVAAPESAVNTYRKQDFTPENFTLDTEVDKEIRITGFDSIKNFVFVTAGIISAEVISPSELSIKGLKTGTTFMHIWDKSELVTLRIIVKYKGYEKSQELLRETLIRKKGQPLKTGYSYYFNKFHLDYANQEREVKTEDDRHRFTLSGDMPYGYFNGYLSYLYRKDQSGKHDDVENYNFTFKNDFFSLEGGDINTSFSNITMPYTHLQGMKFSSPDSDGKIKYDFVLGSTGYYLWGSRLSSYGQIEHRFYGLRTEIAPIKDVLFFTTLMNTTGDSTENTRNVAHRLASVGANYNIGKYLSFEIEAAKNNKQKTAVSTSLGLTFDKFFINTAYKDVTVDYLNLTGDTQDRGKRGLYTSAEFNPVDVLSLSANFNVYQNRLTPDPDSVEKGNRDFSFNTTLSCPPTNTDFLISYYHRDDRGQEFPTVTQGQLYKITQIFNDLFILGDIKGEISYQTDSYKSFITGESNYTDKILRGSVTVRPLKGLTMSIQEMLNFRDWPARDYSTFPRRLSAQARYGSKLWKLPLFFDVHFGYQVDSHVNQDKIALILGEDKIIGGGGLRINIAPYVNAFLNMDIEKIKGSTDPTVDRIRTFINGEVRIDWDTGFVLQGYGTVKGFVFKDIDKNGIMDKEDLPAKGVGILVDGKKKTTTNSRGFYRIKYLEEGSMKISIDPDKVPKDYMATTPLEAKLNINKMGVKEVSFGISPKVIVKGFVFNDLNRNKIFDKEIDEPMRNVLVVLDDGRTAFTESHGYFIVRNATLGKRTLKVDKDTVPTHLLQAPPATVTVEVEEGKEKDVEFIFYALRFIAGRVYLDLNNNNEIDEDEGIERVGLSINGKRTTTDEEGRFILRDLPAGKVEIVIDKNSIPKNAMVEKDTIEVILKKEKDSITDFNIRLLPKS